MYVGAVLPHVAVGHKAGVTHVTLVGLLSCVCPHMDLHLTKVKNAFKADSYYEQIMQGFSLACVHFYWMPLHLKRTYLYFTGSSCKNNLSCATFSVSGGSCLFCSHKTLPEYFDSRIVFIFSFQQFKAKLIKHALKKKKGNFFSLHNSKQHTYNLHYFCLFHFQCQIFVCKVQLSHQSIVACDCVLR